jgi:AcrR family transcriptional regulator
VEEMNDRKQQVMKKAYRLFIEKGFQATSIQDILDYSGISKGTFYNYFSSKNELLIVIFKTIVKKLENERNALLVGQNPSSIEIFIKQIELQLKENEKNKIFPLFEEIIVSNDPDLKQLMKHGQLRMIRWLYSRFIDIFGESKKPYLLDCAIMFLGILYMNSKYYVLAYNSTVSIHQMVRYSVARLVKIVEEVAEADDQLIKPELLTSWLPDFEKTDKAFKQELYYAVLALKKVMSHNKELEKYLELLDFVLDELVHTKNPRKYLIESALLSMKADQSFVGKDEVQKLHQLVTGYFTEKEKDANL